MIRLYLLGYKGYEVFKNIDAPFFAVISDIVVGKDAGVINDFYKEIIYLCNDRNIMHYDRNQEPQNSNDFIIVIGWRWLIKSEKLIIVIHDSILPRLRGFNPLVTALINGDLEIGATGLFASNYYDRGDIIIQKKQTINYPIKIKKAVEIISAIYVKIVNEIIGLIIKNEGIDATAQFEDEVTYSLWRDEDDYIIDWTKSSHEILRFINAVGYPYRGAKTRLVNQDLRIFDAEIVDEVIIENRTPGKVIFKDNYGIVIVCGHGLLRVKHLFMEDLSELDLRNKFRLRLG
jgi:methionyl-tRNA formyltransferase